HLAFVRVNSIFRGEGVEFSLEIELIHFFYLAFLKFDCKENPSMIKYFREDFPQLLVEIRASW
ncbi:hypothetical protein D7V86_23935, partial [bacterium D16-51]